MKRLLVFLVLVMAGCSADHSWPSWKPKPPAVHRDYLSEMKALAHKKGYYYRVFCTPWHSNPDFQFQAMLCERDCRKAEPDIDTYRWQAGTGATQMDAIRDLMERVERDGFVAPKEHPRNHDRDLEWMKKRCPPPIEGGGPGNTETTEIPCSGCAR